MTGAGFAVRTATVDDLDAIVALTTAWRRRLAAWSPRWWNPAAAADALHPQWLRYLLQSDATIVRVVEDAAGEVLGCAAAMRQPAQWVIDDVAVADDSLWPGAGRLLLEAVEERPALLCVPATDEARVAACASAGLRVVSSYWIRETTAGEGADSSGGGSAMPDAVRAVAPDGVPEPPPHTFGPTATGRDGELVIADEDGVVLGSPSIAAPPVYDPGGTVCIIDRIVGVDRVVLLRRAVGRTAARGDVLACVVVSADDADLAVVVAAAGFTRTVDVHAWS